jgi:hypothetical protein
MRRVAPAVALYFLAPLVAEFLLGDFPVTYLPLLLVVAPMYGGGAILVREVTRRTGRGWPTIVLLGLAYAVFEEGVTTQSLFDPDYAHAHLLDRGFVPALGIAVPWTIFVLTLHTVWSISVPVALVEGLTPDRRTRPWLGRVGLVVAAALFVVGSVLTVLISYRTDHFLAPWPALAGTVLIATGLAAAALRLPRSGRHPATARRPPSSWLVFAVALGAGVVHMIGFALPTWVAVAVLAANLAGVTIAVLIWCRRSGWGSRHRLALAAGALLTYSWHAFLMRPVLGDGPVVTPVSHVAFAVAALALLGVEVARSMRPSSGEPAPAAAAAG